MKKYTLILLVAFFGVTLYAQDKNPIEGKWDLTFMLDGKEAPSWLEVKHSGYDTYIGRFVYAFGSARPIAEVKMNGNQFLFEIPRQWEPKGQDMKFSGAVSADGKTIKGEMVYTDGKKRYFKGVPAPKRTYTANPKWGEPIYLFNGKNLNGWSAMGESNQWKVTDGILTSDKAGVNLVSNDKFDDFKIRVVFKFPEGSNSGLYLRGRHEVQIADNAGMAPSNILFAGIYGFLEPTEMAAKPAGEWQVLEATLIGDRVTIVANGNPVIIDRTIPGITGGALDSNEGEPGPIMIQGDHGPVQFREVTIAERID